MYRSIDGGLTWQEITNGLSDQKVICLAINPLNPDIIFAGTDKSIFKSVNGGELWKPLSNWFMNTPVLTIVIDPIDPSVIYVGTWKGVYKSTTGGNFWLSANKGLAKKSLVADLIINKRNPSILYALPSPARVLYKTTDGGKSWNVVYDFEKDFFLYELTIDPVNPNNLYLTHTGSLDDSWTSGRILISRDEGKNWFVPYSRIPFYDIKSLSIDPLNPNCLYASTIGGVYKSVDQGINWTKMSKGLNNLGVNYTVINPINTSIIYAVAGEFYDISNIAHFGIFKSINGGESWTYTGFADKYIRTLVIDPLNPYRIYAVARDANEKGIGIRSCNIT